MADLRDRLAWVVAEAASARRLRPGDSARPVAEELLAVFAAWLRERAKEMERLRGDMTVAADMVDDWADELDPPKGDLNGT